MVRVLRRYDRDAAHAVAKQLAAPKKKPAPPAPPRMARVMYVMPDVLATRAAAPASAPAASPAPLVVPAELVELVSPPPVGPKTPGDAP